MSRRQVLQWLAALGIGNVVFQRAVAAEVAKAKTITGEVLREAEWISGIQLDDEEREDLVRAITDQQAKLERLRDYPIDPQLLPALHFGTTRRESDEVVDRSIELTSAKAIQRPANGSEIAFLSVSQLSMLVRTRQVTALELTELYLQRLKTYDSKLLCVVNLTEDLAREQAMKADAEIAAGRYRGPLHGIPWGAKDLIAYPGYPTTWGAPQHEKRILPEKATVAKRLEDAGAVLVAKLSLGALAMGDQWYRGMTRNPWDLDQGSSGSSAGSASATAAGLVGFALGSETLGSIISPSTRCGTTGLRPTFGRVSRHGCMALSWSMDKIGPIARSVEDTALILAAIHGADGLDATAVNLPFAWSRPESNEKIRIGYLKGEEGIPLDVFRSQGFTLVPVEMPSGYPVWDMTTILTAEAATAFHPWTREGITEGLGGWPKVFRKGHLIPAVDYLRANQIRTQLMEEMESVFDKVDVLLGGGSDELAMSNLTGHPSVIVPTDLVETDGVNRPASLKMTGRWFGETSLLQVAHAFQQATGHHLRQPPGFG